MPGSASRSTGIAAVRPAVRPLIRATPALMSCGSMPTRPCTSATIICAAAGISCGSHDPKASTNDSMIWPAMSSRTGSAVVRPVIRVLTASAPDAISCGAFDTSCAPYSEALLTTSEIIV